MKNSNVFAMVKLWSFLLLLPISNSYAQYNYGLEICEQDAKIEGKLNLDSDNLNIFIGLDVGINNTTSMTNSNHGIMNTYVGWSSGKNNTTGYRNTFIGNLTGFQNTTGWENTFIGASSGNDNTTGFNNLSVGANAGRHTTTGFQNTFVRKASGFENETGNDNTFIGSAAGQENISGSQNIYIGQLAGRFNQIGDGNIFVGFRAGYNELGSDKLYIENSDSSTPLIYGEFDNNKVQINGSLHISEFTRLIPSSTPTSPEKGTMYYDSSDDKVKVWTGSAWENLFFSTSTQTESSFTSSNDSPCNTSCYEVKEENQKLKATMEQLEAEVKEFSSMKSDLEEMKRLVSKLSESQNLNQKVKIIQSARLGQNVPNPFNGTTKIQYSLPENIKDARIKIYDISGRIVKEVKIEGSGQGEVEVQVDESSTGIYHYSLEIDGQVIDTKKMSSIK